MIKAQVSLDTIRDELKKNIGKRVNVKAKKGRKRIGIEGAVIEEAYPSLFTIVISRSGSPERQSYTYSDILTKNVELKILENQGRS